MTKVVSNNEQLDGDVITLPKVASLNEFLDAVLPFQQLAVVENRDASHPFLLFRGCKTGAPLKARIENFRGDHKSINCGKVLFDEFKKRCGLGRSFSDWDVLALAQHFDLPTRYLDWTGNSLVALWFAVNSRNEDACGADTRDAEVWVLRTENGDFAPDVEKTELFPSGCGKTFLFKPTELEQRIGNQNSFMMRQVYVYKDPCHKRTGAAEQLIIETVDKNPDFSNRLWRIPIDKENFAIIRNQLSRYGISKQYLFADKSLFDRKRMEAIVTECENVVRKQYASPKNKDM